MLFMRVGFPRGDGESIAPLTIGLGLVLIGSGHCFHVSSALIGGREVRHHPHSMSIPRLSLQIRALHGFFDKRKSADDGQV